MAWFHSIKLALIRRFLGARHHSAWCSGNGQPRRASSKSGCVWETAEQSRRMHAAGRVTVLSRSLPRSKEIESPMFPPHLLKPPSSAGTAGHRIPPVSGTWVHRTCEQSDRAPSSLDVQTGPGMRGLEQRRAGFCLQRTCGGHPYRMSRREVLFMGRKWDVWATVT